MKKFVLFIVILSLTFLTISLYAAYLEDVPIEITQPDGTVINCFASGDEFHNWAHDENDFTIIQNPDTGWYVYAIIVNDKLIASSYRVGSIDPRQVGIKPGLNITPEEWEKKRDDFLTLPENSRDTRMPNTGTVRNLVIFVRFNDQTEFPGSYSSYSDAFNASTGNSLANYYDEVSNGQLDVVSHLYPEPSGNVIVSYQDSHNRDYFCPYNAVTNPTGYNGGTERKNREWQLLRDAIDYANSDIPNWLDFDADDDGDIDNAVFIVRGSPTAWNTLLWPHKWNIQTSPFPVVNGATLNVYNLQIESMFEIGVLCHEMFHSIGAPDLYHYTGNGISPVGPWDLMENTANPPQHMLTYMKWKYGGWFSSIPTISSSGTYTLSPVSTSPYSCYKIASPNSMDEYYMVEYRRNEGTFESSVPGSGLIVYRIDTTAGNGNAGGPPDEVYVYRPGGTTSSNGVVNNAYFSQNVGRTAIHEFSDPTPFLQDGSAGGLVLYDIGSSDSSISFTYSTEMPFIWEGDVSNDWYNSSNWVNNAVPAIYDNVIIPSGTTYSPLISHETANCKDLTIESGATLTQTGTSYFYVYGNFNSDAGTFTQSGLSYLYFAGPTNTSWDDDNEDDTYSYVRIIKDSNTASLSMWQDMTVDNNIEVREGVFKIDSSWTLTVNGTYTNAFQVETGGTFNLSGNQIINVAGGIEFEDGSKENVIGGTMKCGGSLTILANSSYDITFAGGLLEMDGSGPQYIDDQDGGTLDIYNLTIAKTGGVCYIQSANLDVNGNMIISGGTLSPGTYNINVGGDWTNTVGTAGFTEGTGRVIFDGGNYHQYCSNETFNELEVNKPSGGAFRVNGTNVVCAAYDWTAGAVDVLSGSFTANDLLDNGISGAFYLNSGGTIDLINTGGWVDLNGELHIFGGTMTVAGPVSDWTYSHDALIEMSGGVLDFTECGINIYNSPTYSLTENITGGTIRTSGKFTGNRAGFNPSGGTIELYGTTDANISHVAGSNFYDVLINKAVSDEITKKSKEEKRIVHNRDGSVVELTRSNTITATSDLDINGDLQIDSGTFNLSGNTVNVGVDVMNYGVLTVDAILDIGNDFYLYSGSTVNLSGTISLGTSAGWHGEASHYSGSTFNQTAGDYYVESILLANGSQFNGTGGTTHMYVNGYSAINAIEIDDPDSYFYQFYVDTGANAALTSCSYDLEVSYASQIRAPLDINSYEMNVNYFDVYDAGELIIDSGGTVNVTGNGPYIHNTGALTMAPGSELNSALNIQFWAGSIESVSGGDIYLGGNFTNVDEIFTPTGGSVTFDGSIAASIIGTTAFYDLNINKTGATVTSDTTFSMHDLDINSGVLDPSNHTIEVSGDWTNTVGTAGFTEGTGRVVFNSADHQYCYGETFNILELNKPMMDFIIPNSTTTTCQQLDWTDYNGELEVDGGTFIAYDLEENGLFGNYYLTSNGGLLELHQDGVQYVDLDGQIVILGGTMNIYGGNGASYWPYFADGTITMSGGVLDYKDVGIYIYNSPSYSLTETITGGTIRTAYGFTGDRADFNPTGGTIELYGTTDADISMGTGSNFYDVLINKAVSDEITRESKDDKKIVHNRDGSVVELTRDNNVNAISNLDIDGDFTIDTGVFNITGYDMSVSGNWANHVGDTGFTEGTQTVTFDGATYTDILTSETFYNLIVNKIIYNFEGLELASGSSLHVLNNLTISDGTLEMNNNSILNVENDVYIALDAGLNAYSDTGLNLYVGGNWTNDNTDWDTIYGYSPGSETITFNGNTDQIITTAAPQEDFGNLVIDKSGGEFRSNDNIHVMHDLDILTGNWNDNVPSLTHYFEGDVYVTEGSSAGFNSTTGNTVVFKGTADQTVYYPYGYYYFHDVIVDKTAWPTRNFSNREGAESTLSRQDNMNLSGDATETRAMTVTLNSSIDMEFGNGLTIEEGTLDLNGNTFYTMGDVIINDGGTIVVDEGAQLRLHDGYALNVNSGGEIEVIGTSGNLATVTHRSAGYYDFDIENGGTIAAEYAHFQYMGSNGVYVKPGGLIDPNYTFNYCTFENGTPGYAPLVVFNNDQTLTCTEVNFPQAGVTDFNAAKAQGTGIITFVDAYGDFAGETYEYDPGNDQIDWITSGLPEIDDLTIQYNAGSDEIELDWSAVSGATSYNVYSSTDPYATFPGGWTLEPLGTAIISTDWSESASGNTKFYCVTAVNGADNSVSRGNVTSSDSAPWSK